MISLTTCFFLVFSILFLINHEVVESRQPTKSVLELNAVQLQCFNNIRNVFDVDLTQVHRKKYLQYAMRYLSFVKSDDPSSEDKAETSNRTSSVVADQLYDGKHNVIVQNKDAYDYFALLPNWINAEQIPWPVDFCLGRTKKISLRSQYCMISIHQNGEYPRTDEKNEIAIYALQNKVKKGIEADRSYFFAEDYENIDFADAYLAEISAVVIANDAMFWPEDYCFHKYNDDPKSKQCILRISDSRYKSKKKNKTKY